MRKIIDWLLGSIICLLAIMGTMFIVILYYVSTDAYKEPEHKAVITVSKLGYLVVDGDTTEYVLKEVKAYKMERRKNERTIQKAT